LFGKKKIEDKGMEFKPFVKKEKIVVPKKVLSKDSFSRLLKEQENAIKKQNDNLSKSEKLRLELDSVQKKLERMKK
jgi:ATP-dependent protease HslVU (ClpYQ) ATPase subunit